MLNIMKLEWEKHHLSSYLKYLAICIISIFAAVALMAIGSQSENEPMFTDYASYMSLTNILIRVVFVIFAGVIVSRLVIEEYRAKTIQILFCYPIQRKKLILVKLSIVFFFCFFSIIVTTIFINMLTFYLNPVWGFFDTPVTMGEIISTFPSTLITAFMIAGVSLIPLYFGMRKKSTSTTVTSAVLIGFLVNATVSDGGGSVSLFQFIFVPVILCLLGLGIGYVAFHKVEQADVS